jgi:GTP-binding protein
MDIRSAKFETSATNCKKMMGSGKSEIAFVGRSNVGKSSLINMLVKNSKLCRTSSTPGRTRLINYFLINNEFYFVDLPGYGYAKASKTEVDGWQSMIEPYLIDNPQLKCVCMLVDSRFEPTAQDKQMLKFLNYYQIPFIIIATKCDKLNQSQKSKVINNIVDRFQLKNPGNIYLSGLKNQKSFDNIIQAIYDICEVEK